MFPIDESRNTGNAEIIEAVFREPGLDLNERELSSRMKFVLGDQLSISRLRSVATIRAGNEGDRQSFLWMGKVPGPFHYMGATTEGLR